jgi:hypothetical protein
LRSTDAVIHARLVSGILAAKAFVLPKVSQQGGLIQPFLRFRTNDPSEGLVSGGGSDGKEDAYRTDRHKWLIARHGKPLSFRNAALWRNARQPLNVRCASSRLI